MTDLLLLLLAFFNSTLKERRDLALENLALRQQLAVLKQGGKRPAIKKKDRLFWVWLSRIWKGWRESLVIVKPETVIPGIARVSDFIGRSCRAADTAVVLRSVRR